MSLPNYTLLHLNQIHWYILTCFTNMKKRISYAHWWLIISSACMLKILLQPKNEMNVEPTFFHIHGWHTRTSHQKYQFLLMYFTSWNDSLLGNIIMQIQTLRIQKFLIHASLHEDMQKVQLGGMLGLRNVAFLSSFPFSIPHILVGVTSHTPRIYFS